MSLIRFIDRQVVVFFLMSGHGFHKTRNGIPSVSYSSSHLIGFSTAMLFS
jgi:hypothetical protein